MMRASVKGEDGAFLVLAGLTEENVARLKAGFPIRAALPTFGIDLPGTLGIVYGRTHADLERMVNEAGGAVRTSADPRVDQYEAILGRHERVLIATVGLPRSGKSSWARQQSYPVVNPDAIRLALHGQRFAANAEPFVWATAKLMVRALFLAGHKTVILDATNVTRKRRDEWRSDEWATFFKLVLTPREECRRRAEAEGDAEILPVIDRMVETREPLGPDEQQWP